MDDLEFTRIDRMIFDRLHRGSLDPLSLRLKDGRHVTGELVAIHRIGAVGRSQDGGTGVISLNGDEGRISVDYDEISEIE